LASFNPATTDAIALRVEHTVDNTLDSFDKSSRISLNVDRMFHEEEEDEDLRMGA
jgi:hypothetical protein